MNSNCIETVVVVGGGTAGWMAAAALSNDLGRKYSIRVVESDMIATVGVGEATIPLLKHFHQVLGIDEDDFLRATNGTFKLGIEFVDWAEIGKCYIHGFGTIGRPFANCSFHQFWLKESQRRVMPPLGQFSINTVAPMVSKYVRGIPELGDSPLADINNAFHFDAGLYAKFLRKYAEARGVVRTEGKIVQVQQHAETGHLQTLVLENGLTVSGDFFIDCTGMRALLIQDTLQSGFEDWSHWLPCDRAIAVPCASVEPLLPITRATARAAGWQWRIPLQNRIGNGHVYSSRFMDSEEATQILLRNLDGEPLAEPKHISFLPGRRTTPWVKNCVAVGLAAGFFEPIESTNIHLIQTSIQRILSLFPNRGFHQADIDEYNRQTSTEYEQIRDFIILHYKATQREDTAFWRHCRAMQIPSTLQHKMDLFKSNGRFFRENNELFTETSWVQVMLGQGIRPDNYDPLGDLVEASEAQDFVNNVGAVIQKCVAVMPSHAEFIAQHCAAQPLV